MMLDLSSAKKNDGSINHSSLGDDIIITFVEDHPEITQTLLSLKKQYGGINVISVDDSKKYFIEISDESTWDLSVIADIVYNYVKEKGLNMKYNPEDFKKS
ncbi:hypothetical protein [Planktothrix agardhii]|jgi:hypothetical protein|uniref:hypothetical protein n=1 Tax=Planktothrix agardhii TaxID=1160 RepID=UPI0020A7554E|nr:hypothetical protein [Planktothrix agardhii]